MATSPDAVARTASERARALIEAIGRQDLEAMRAAWDGDTVDDFVALEQQVRGPEALAAFFVEMFAAVPDVRLEVEDAFSEGEKAVVRWRFTGTFTGAPFQGIRATGRALDFRGIDVMEFAGETLRRNTIYYDGATFARQVGMLPPLRSTGDRAMTGAFNAFTTARQRLQQRG